jgi:hypothetical protein
MEGALRPVIDDLHDLPILVWEMEATVISLLAVLNMAATLKDELRHAWSRDGVRQAHVRDISFAIAA